MDLRQNYEIYVLEILLIEPDSNIYKTLYGI